MLTSLSLALLALGCGKTIIITEEPGSGPKPSVTDDTGEPSETGDDTGSPEETGEPPAPFGLDERPTNLSCHAPARPEVGADATLARVFSDVGFALPTAMVLQPSGSHWFVAEKAGEVWRFDNDLDSQSRSRVLDIGHRLDVASEMGMLGMTLHPDFESNGYMYTYVTDNTGGSLWSRLSRFEWNASAEVFDPDSETVILALTQPYSNHNGGQLAFGPDGYLYWGLGDGGSAGDPGGRAQNTDTLLGSILRIDVDGGTPYAIPEDNPFADGGGEPEIYAWGLRNPWTFHFDPATGRLWAGDVGQYAWEEIDLIERGGNYGWNLMEGTHCYATTPCASPELIEPIIEYPNPGGASVVGGPVYQGDLVPSLQGTVLYSDFYTGELWGIETDPLTAEVSKTLFASMPGHYFSGFAQDNHGEVYVHNYYDGAIYRVEAGTGVPVETIPTQLAETGCVDPDDPTQPAPGLIPYGLNAPLWSDGADKQRWMALPDGETVTVASDGQLQFPIGTVLLKQFTKDEVLLETRLMVRHDDGDWGGYAYAWDETGGSAQWERGGASIELDDGHWTVPTMTQCMQCHADAADRALGPELQQLERDYTYPNGRTRSQLQTLEHIGIFSEDLPETVSPLPAVDDEDASLHDRARAVLHVNCSSCHQPGSTGGSEMDLRFSTPLADMGACSIEPDAGDLGVYGATLLSPGEPERSMIAIRMGRRGLGQMPPLGTDQIDEAGLSVVQDWIDSLESCP